jgi:hypothetical protein
MDYRRMTAPCGIPCFECNVFKAKADPALRKTVSERTGIPVEKAWCDGCRDRDGKCFLFEKNTIFPKGTCSLFANDRGQCKIYRCAEGRKLHNCSECAEFPCDLLHPLADNAVRVPHNTKLFHLCTIKKMGLEAWAKEKAAAILRKYYREKFGE